MKVFSFIFFQKFYSFSFYIEVHISFLVQLCVCCEVRVKVHFFLHVASFIEMIVLASFIKNMISSIKFLW